ncbi:hypothetical protein Tco_1112950 [Tanacetum coccineum]|uniref:Uncharacterized protein n=1 Tax=Tanacetum coccineum TaxID=301880 RepID=A0ABQ5IT55_9ASTR
MIFDLQEFFLPEELLPSKKRWRDRSSSSTPTLPQAYEMGESSHKTSRVIIQQDFDQLEVELQKTRSRIAKLQRKQLGQNNKIAFARFRISNLEKIIEEIQARHQADQEDLQDTIYKLRINKEGPSDN